MRIGFFRDFPTSSHTNYAKTIKILNAIGKPDRSAHTVLPANWITDWFFVQSAVVWSWNGFSDGQQFFLKKTCKTRANDHSLDPMVLTFSRCATPDDWLFSEQSVSSEILHCQSFEVNPFCKGPNTSYSTHESDESHATVADFSSKRCYSAVLRVSDHPSAYLLTLPHPVRNDTRPCVPSLHTSRLSQHNSPSCCNLNFILLTN